MPQSRLMDFDGSANYAARHRSPAAEIDIAGMGQIEAAPGEAIILNRGAVSYAALIADPTALETHLKAAE
jgi:hypothetical protein